LESINTDVEDDSWLINTRTGYNHDLGFPNLCDSLELTNVEDEGMAILVVEFSSGGYKILYIFA
jgi:hypothetical protein